MVLTGVLLFVGALFNLVRTPGSAHSLAAPCATPLDGWHTQPPRCTVAPAMQCSRYCKRCPALLNPQQPVGLFSVFIAVFVSAGASEGPAFSYTSRWPAAPHPAAIASHPSPGTARVPNARRIPPAHPPPPTPPPDPECGALSDGQAHRPGPGPGAGLVRDCTWGPLPGCAARSTRWAQGLRQMNRPARGARDCWQRGPSLRHQWGRQPACTLAHSMPHQARLTAHRLGAPTGHELDWLRRGSDRTAGVLPAVP